MAKRQSDRSNGARPGRGPGGTSSRSSRSGGRPSATGRSGLLGALAIVAAALAGGSYLYLHTPAAPHSVASTPASVSEAEPAPAPPGTATQASSGPQSRGATSKPPAVLPSVSSGTPTAVPLAPFGTSEEVFEAGARLYTANCAGCHGRPGKNAGGPLAAQFWDRDNTAGAHAVSEPAGALYQATAKGNLTQGMPSFGQRLTDTQIWDLALLVKNAHDDLPDPVARLLRAGR